MKLGKFETCVKLTYPRLFTASLFTYSKEKASAGERETHREGGGGSGVCEGSEHEE